MCEFVPYGLWAAFKSPAAVNFRHSQPPRETVFIDRCFKAAIWYCYRLRPVAATSYRIIIRPDVSLISEKALLSRKGDKWIYPTRLFGQMKNENGTILWSAAAVLYICRYITF